MISRGIFITIEGGEGAGKSSLIERIRRFLTSKGCEVIATREPGGVAIAEQIRAVLLDERNVQMDAKTEALLYAASRRQHLVEKVLPALKSGKVIVCDRFIDSSLAYQGHARGLGIEQVLAVNLFAIGEIMPDITLYMDVEPEVGLARIAANPERELNRLDLETMEFHRKIREGYLKLAQRFPERIVQIDANQTADEVFAEACIILTEKLL